MKRSHFLMVATFVAACGQTPHTTSSEQATEVAFDLAYVRVPLDMLTQQWVQKTGFNRDHAYLKDYALGYLAAENLAQLSAHDRTRLVELNATDIAQGFIDPVSLQETFLKSAVVNDADEDYHNYDAMTKELQDLAAAAPNRMQLLNAGTSVKGRTLWLAKVGSDLSNDTDKPKLLYVANMHGDEAVGRELMIYHLRRLINDYDKDPRITALVDNAQIFIMPSMNPDGFENRSRYSSAGLDLNRNFPDFTSDNRDNPKGRGIETQALMKLHDQHHFVATINFHGGDVCFNLPWDTQPNKNAAQRFGDDALLNSLGRAYADANPTMELNDTGNFDRGLTYGYEWYEVDGGMQDWSIYYRNSMHATIELTYTKYPPKSQLPKAWSDNKEPLLAFMESAMRGLHLEVVDADGNPIPNVSVEISSAKRRLTYTGPYLHRPTLPGMQQVTLTAAGFKAQTVSLTPTVFDGTYQKIVMQAP